MKYIKIKLEHGIEDILIEINEDIAPLGTKYIIQNIKNHVYDEHKIERLEPNFVMQPLFFDGLNPVLDQMIDGEFKNDNNKIIPFRLGIVALAGDESCSSTSQFFICLSDAPRLNAKFTVIGKVISGFEELKRLNNLEVESSIEGGFTYHYPKVDEIIETIELTK